MIKNRYYLYFPVATLVILFLLGTFFDLNIAQGLGVHSDFLTASTAIVLPLLACSAVSFICGFLFSDAFKHFDNKWKKIIFMIIAIGVFVFAIYVSQKEIISKDGLNMKTAYYISIPIALLFNGVASVFGYKAGLKNDNIKIYKLIIFILAIVVFTIGLCYLLKKVMHRLRYVALVNPELEFTLDDFTSWYKSSPLFDSFTGEKWYFESFPSGHSSIVMTSGVTLPFIFSRYEWGRKHQLVTFIAALLITYLMAFTRVYSGSHYLSDVTFPGFLVFIPHVVGYELYFKNFRVSPIESKDF